MFDFLKGKQHESNRIPWVPAGFAGMKDGPGAAGRNLKEIVKRTVSLKI